MNQQEVRLRQRAVGTRTIPVRCCRPLGFPRNVPHMGSFRVEYQTAPPSLHRPQQSFQGGPRQRPGPGARSPALLCSQADSGHAQRPAPALRLTGPVLGGHVRHAQHSGLHVEALDDLGAGVVEGNDGDLAHLTGTAPDLRVGGRSEQGAPTKPAQLTPHGRSETWLWSGNQLPTVLNELPCMVPLRPSMFNQVAFS